MEHRGFYIDACYDTGIERTSSLGRRDVCCGYYCQVYVDEDMPMQIDDFGLASGYELADEDCDTLEKTIKNIVDENYEMYVKTCEKLLKETMRMGE